MKKNLFSIGKKQVRVPIVQGGMGVGISLGRLAGTVAKEGGAGTISAAQIGFKEPDFYENPIEANKRAIHKEMQKARAISPDGIVGFNLMVAMNDYETYVHEVIAAGADFIVSVGSFFDKFFTTIRTSMYCSIFSSDHPCPLFFTCIGTKPSTVFNIVNIIIHSHWLFTVCTGCMFYKIGISTSFATKVFRLKI